MIREAIVVLVSICCLGATLQLMDFGVTSGDSLVDGFFSENRASSAKLTLLRPVVFYGASFTSIFVNSNGFISLGEDRQIVFDQDLSGINGPIVAPYWAAVNNGTIYYRISHSSNDLTTARSIIRRYFSDSRRFNPTDLVIVTWHQVSSQANGIDQNTFQVVLSTDGNSTYAQFSYDDTGWFEFNSSSINTGSGSGSGVTMSTITAQAGLVNGSESYLLPGSGTENITLLNVTSNVGMQGVWLFRLHNFSPGALCSDGDVRLNVGTGYDYIYGTANLDDFYYSDPFNDRQLSRGTVEVCYSGIWGTICDDQWDNSEASVVCTQLNFSPYGSLAIRHQFSDRVGPVLVGGLNCSGTELRLSNCSFTLRPATCTGQTYTAVACQELSTLAGNCNDGQVRLVGGSNSSLGRVEVCINNAWGTVCNSRFGTNEARVICHQLGYSNTVAQAFRSTASLFGQSSGPIFLENLACSGTEQRLFDCPRSILGTHECDHSQDAGVQCFDIDQCSTNNGGCEQICTNLVPGFECSCNNGFILNSDGMSCSDNFSCNDGVVRLANGSTVMEGRVEVCYNNTYHTVCDDFWDELEAQVVCRQLGFSTSPGAVAVRNSLFGQGNGSILLDDVMCTGNEVSLLNCPRRNNIPLLSSNCDHSEDAGVMCQVVCRDGAVRLVVSEDADTFYMGMTNYDSTYFDKDGLRVGRVEVCVGGRYGTICMKSWDDRDASVVCRQAGFSPYGAIAISADSFDEGNSDRVYTGVNCVGNESRLVDCNLSAFSGFFCETVGVVCQSIATANGMCNTSEVRLVDSSSDTNSQQGRLEVCINNAWGTVCDNLFGSEDAAVACSRVTGFTGQGASVLPRGSVGSGDGPIFLSDLNCVGSEMSLLECLRQDNQPVGLQSCDHTSDVSVRCIDVDECQNNNGDCEQNCTNSVGSFFCNCTDGFLLRDDLLQCDDVDECQSNNGGCEQNCTNTVSSFFCNCTDGFLLRDNFQCDDIDECSVNHDTCDSNAVCTNTNGSFLCMCAVGYTGNGSFCIDVNECSNNSCHENADCMNSAGSFLCICQNGYTGDGTNCSDIDECSRNSGGCNETTSVCINIVGSVQCECLDGFRNASNQECTNINECDMNVSVCHDNATCADTFGSFNCICNTGFMGNGTVCQNIDECSNSSLNNCGSHAECTDIPGSFQCNCISGFTGNGTTCSDIDECEATPCSAVATCENIVGGYHCTCTSGYTGNGSECGDIDECSVSPDVCDSNATCTNTNGSFLCECMTGYTGNGSICMDINECVSLDMESGVCHDNATCTNTPGSFTCTCSSGFLGNGTNCQNIDECSNSSLNNCDSHAECTDIPGSFQCNCISGFTGNGTTCFEIDECALAPCSTAATCENTIGSYNCTCNSGYTGNGSHCADVDECLLSDVQCENANCVNTNGSYTCECLRGFCRSNESDIQSSCVCSDGDVLLLNGTVNTGQVAVCVNNSYISVCYDQWDILDAGVVCKQLGHDFSTAIIIRGNVFSDEMASVLISGVNCLGNESNLLGCSHNQTSLSRCSSNSTAGVLCGVSCVEGAVRQFSHAPSRSMVVEICRNGNYTTICGQSWGNEEASVVCNQLGFSTTGAIGLLINGLLFSDLGLELVNYQCAGGERNLSSCIANTLTTSCQAVAAVRCQALCMDGDLRLNVADDYQYFAGDTQYDDAFFIGETSGMGLIRGRVEVCINSTQTWGVVCDDNWTNLDASVACRQLDFSRYGAIAISSGPMFLASSSRTVELIRPECLGNESMLTGCSQHNSLTCTSQQGVGVACQDISTPVGNCNDGDVRLVGGSNLTVGRVEVCINNAWGTVCNNRFGTNEALVTCRQLGYSDTRANTIIRGVASFGVPSNPIFLDNLACTGTELNLLACPRSVLGLHQCDHSQDVGMECFDVNQCMTNNGGCQQTCVNMLPGFTCTCNIGYTLNVDGTTCADVNECEDVNSNNCEQECSNTVGSFFCTCMDGFSVVNGTKCRQCLDGDVRLVGANSSSEGRVEVCYNGSFHSVCDDFWDALNAQVVCRQLGFPSSSGK